MQSYGITGRETPLTLLKEAESSIHEYFASEQFNIMRFVKGHTIYREENYPTGLYAVISGKVKICMKGDGGKEQITRIAVKNDCLGLEYVIKDSKYCSSAIALTETETIFISKDKFNDLVQTNARLAHAFAALLSKNIIDREQKLTSISYTPVRGRLAGALLFLDSKFNGDGDGSIILTRSELASYIGSVQETTTRVLSEFKNEKLVEISGRKINIINRDKLMSIRNLYR